MQPLTQSQHKEILQLFVSSDEMRPVFHTPLRILDKKGKEITVATDTMAMAVVRGHLGDGRVYDLDESAKYNRVIIEERNQSLKYKVQDFEDAVEKTPFVLVKKGDECEACDGDGYVDFEFDHEMKTFYHEAACPICDSKGEVNIRETDEKEYDYEFRTQIGKDHFSAIQLKRLAEAARIAQQEYIYLTYQCQEGLRTNVFQIADVEIMQMPLNRYGNERPEIVLLSCLA